MKKNLLKTAVKLPSIKKYLFLISVFALLITPSFPQAKTDSISGTGKISGRILRKDSYLHDGSRVVIRQGKLKIAVETDEKGEYLFKAVPAGIYELFANSEEYFPVIKRGVKVESDANITLDDIVLSPNFDGADPLLLETRPARGAVDVAIPNTFGINGLEGGITSIFISFDFSKPMVKDSFEKSLVFTPAVNHLFLWSGRKRVVIKCDTLSGENPLKPSTQYKIEFKEGSLAIDGRKLVKQEPLIFTTGVFRFLSFAPSNIRPYPLSNRYLEYYFNCPLDKDSVNDFNIEIYPAIKGTFTLKDNRSNQVGFTAEKYLPSSAVYTVTLKKELKCRSGQMLGSDLNLNFTTEPLKVLTTWPKNKEKNILARGAPYLFFNSRIKRETVEKGISFKPDIPWEPLWTAEDNTEYCILKHTQNFNVNTEYILNVDERVTDLYGRKLKEPVKLIFKTEACRVSGFQPAEGSINVDPKSEIRIIFNTRMNREETEKSISIEPKTDVVFLWSSPENYDILSIVARNGWEARSGCVFKVAKSAKGMNGEKLVKEFKGTINIK